MKEPQKRTTKFLILRNELSLLKYEKRLFSPSELEIIIYYCSDKLSIEEIANKKNLSRGAIRKYLLNIRQKFERDLCQYAHQLGPSWDIAILWKNTSDYKKTKTFIKNCQSYEVDNYDLDNDTLDQAIARKD